MRSLSLVLIVALLPLGLTACGDSPKDKLVGTWVVDVDAMQGDLQSSAEGMFPPLEEDASDEQRTQRAQQVSGMVARMTEMVGGYSFTFDGDGTFTITMGDESRSGTWEVKEATGDQITVTQQEEDKEAEDVTIQLIDGGQKSQIETEGEGPALTLTRSSE